MRRKRRSRITNKKAWRKCQRWRRESRPSVGLGTSNDVRDKVEQDITGCTCLNYGDYIGCETRSVEFKRGGGRYMQDTFEDDACIYGCAFLNSGGGSLLVGVGDDGVVCGVRLTHKSEDETRLQVDKIMKKFNPPLLPSNYNLHFLTVMKPFDKGEQLKVLRLTFGPIPAFREPTLYQFDQGKVYVMRDGSVQGPLGPSVILEWSRQMWTDKVQGLKRRVHALQLKNRFLTGQVLGLSTALHCRETTGADGQKKETEMQGEAEDPPLAPGSPPPPDDSCNA